MHTGWIANSISSLIVSWNYKLKFTSYGIIITKFSVVRSITPSFHSVNAKLMWLHACFTMLIYTIKVHKECNTRHITTLGIYFKVNLCEIQLYLINVHCRFTYYTSSNVRSVTRTSRLTSSADQMAWSRSNFDRWSSDPSLIWCNEIVRDLSSELGSQSDLSSRDPRFWSDMVQRALKCCVLCN